MLAGHDLLAGAQTGTGKTAAFGLPLLQHLGTSPQPVNGPRKPRALILTPPANWPPRCMTACAATASTCAFPAQ